MLLDRIEKLGRIVLWLAISSACVLAPITYLKLQSAAAEMAEASRKADAEEAAKKAQADLDERSGKTQRLTLASIGIVPVLVGRDAGTDRVHERVVTKRLSLRHRHGEKPRDGKVDDLNPGLQGRLPVRLDGRTFGDVRRRGDEHRLSQLIVRFRRWRRPTGRRHRDGRRASEGAGGSGCSSKGGSGGSALGLMIDVPRGGTEGLMSQRRWSGQVLFEDGVEWRVLRLCPTCWGSAVDPPRKPFEMTASAPIGACPHCTDGMQVQRFKTTAEFKRFASTVPDEA